MISKEESLQTSKLGLKSFAFQQQVCGKETSFSANMRFRCHVIFQFRTFEREVGAQQPPPNHLGKGQGFTFVAKALPCCVQRQPVIQMRCIDVAMPPSSRPTIKMWKLLKGCGKKEEEFETIHNQHRTWVSNGVLGLNFCAQFVETSSLSQFSSSTDIQFHEGEYRNPTGHFA